MAFDFPDGFETSIGRLGTYYNGEARTAANPGGMDQYGYVENFVPALRDVTVTGQGLAAFADYLNATVSPLAQQAVEAATATAADRVATGQDRTATGQDRTATGQDRVVTGQDKVATAADRVQTGQDRTATGQDRTQTGLDRVATGEDRVATAADRVATGQDRAAAAQSANKLAGTSSTSTSIGTGSKTFTTQADKFFGAGTSVTISADSNPSGLRMVGVVTGYSGTTLSVNVAATSGSGTYADWTIRVSGAAGRDGSNGWSPIEANVVDGARVVVKVVDWIGGSGTKPPVDVFKSPAGYTSNSAEATDVRGAAGAGAGNVNTDGAVLVNQVALFADGTGTLIKSGGTLAAVAISGSYGDLADTPDIPSTPGDISAAEASALDDHVADDTRHFTTTEKAKLGHIAVSQAVDLDAIESRVNQLDAAVVLVGVWDASSGSFPGGGAAQAGQSWIVSTGGSVDGVEFSVNDRVIAIADNTATATYAGNWHKADYTDRVNTVAGRTGNVDLGTDDINGLGTAASEDVGAFATAAEGVLAAASLPRSGGVMTGTITFAAEQTATAANWRAGTANKLLTADGIGAASAPVALADAATVAIDWSTFVTATLAMAGNRTLGNPTNVVPGTSRSIFITSTTSTERTPAYGANYKGPLPEETVTNTVGLLLTLTALTTTRIVPTWKVVEL